MPDTPTTPAAPAPAPTKPKTRKPKKASPTRKKAAGNALLREARQVAMQQWFRNNIGPILSRPEPFQSMNQLHKAFVGEMGDFPFSTFCDLCRQVGLQTVTQVVVPTDFFSAAPPSGEGVQHSSSSDSSSLGSEEDDEPLFDNEVRKPNALVSR